MYNHYVVVNISVAVRKRLMVIGHCCCAMEQSVCHSQCISVIVCVFCVAEHSLYLSTVCQRSNDVTMLDVLSCFSTKICRNCVFIF